MSGSRNPFLVDNVPPAPETTIRGVMSLASLGSGDGAPLPSGDGSAVPVPSHPFLQNGVPPTANRGVILTIPGRSGVVKSCEGVHSDTVPVAQPSCSWIADLVGEEAVDEIDGRACQLPPVSGEIVAVEHVGYFWRLGLDHLRVGFYMSGMSWDITRDALIKEKTMLAEAPAAMRKPKPFKLGGVDLQLQATGTKTYKVLLSNTNEGVSVRLDCRFKTNPPLSIEFSGVWMLRHSIQETYDTAWAMLDSLASRTDVERTQIGRLDQRADIPVQFDASWENALHGPSSSGFDCLKDKKSGKKSSLVNYSQSGIKCRIYDKCREGSAEWLSAVRGWGIEIKTKQAPDGIPVTRTEFEVSRPELVQHGIETLEDILDAGKLLRLWRRCTDRIWFAAIGCEGKRRSRAELRDWWHMLTRLGQPFEKVPDYTQSVEITTHRMRVGAGCIASEVAASAVQTVTEDVESCINDIYVQAETNGGIKAAKAARKRVKKLLRNLDRICADAASKRGTALQDSYNEAIQEYSVFRPTARRFRYLPVVPVAESDHDEVS